MPSERIGRDPAIQYSKRSYPYAHVDPCQIFYISRGGLCEREAIIRDCLRDMSNWAKGIGGARGYCGGTGGVSEQQIREYVKWQENREKEIEKKQLNMFK